MKCDKCRFPMISAHDGNERYFRCTRCRQEYWRGSEPFEIITKRKVRYPRKVFPSIFEAFEM